MTHARAEQIGFASAANEQARHALAGRYLVHTLANAARLAREGDAGRLTGIAAGMPAVIAAAGPSLDANRADLNRVRDRALLIACDTAARPLLSLGLEPHLIVALDPSAANAGHLGALPLPARSWLVAEGSLHPSAFALFEQRTFFFRVDEHAPWPWLHTAGLDCQRLDVWGSVITAAFDLALRMGCSPIVFAGADLAFTGGRPYCRGTTLEAQWAAWVAGGGSYEQAFALSVDQWPRVDAPDLHGVETHTAAHLLAFRDWLVARAGQAASTRVVNASGAGVLHGAAIAIARARDVLADAPPIDASAFDTRLRAAHASIDRRASLFEHVAALTAIASPAALRAWRADTGLTLSDTDLLAPLRGPEFTAWTLARQPHARTAPSS